MGILALLLITISLHTSANRWQGRNVRLQ